MHMQKKLNLIKPKVYFQGFRELFQNFMDACIEKYPQYKMLHHTDAQNKVTFTQAKYAGSWQKIEGNYICYDKIQKTLTFQNQKAFPVRCLLMGCSQKGPQALGQFGEGMKLSMIVILKAGLNITIESGDNIYYPTIKDWDHNELYKNKYQHKVLYVKVKAKQFADKTKVTVQNVDEAKFNEFLYLSLALLDQSKYEKITCGNSTLIISKDPKLIGNIYKKGVLLQIHQSANSQKFAHYSYDLDTIQVSRDRNCVNNVWDLYKLQSQLHYNVMCKFLDDNFMSNNPHLRPLLKQHVSNIYTYLSQNNFQTYFFHNSSNNNQPVCDLIYDKFLQVNGSPAQLYPYCENLASIQQVLKLYGLPNTFYPIVGVSWQLWHTLIYSKKYKTINKKVNESLNKQIRELTADQTNKMNILKQKMALFPEINGFAFKVKLIKQIACCKDQDATKKIIYLNPGDIDNADKMGRAICRMLLFK